MTEENTCIYCKDGFVEEDHIIVIEEEGNVHYNCYPNWLNEKFDTNEAIFRNGNIVDI